MHDPVRVRLGERFAGLHQVVGGIDEREPIAALAERREIAAAALRGGYPEGAPVNFDAVPLICTKETLEALDTTAPVGVFDGAVRVRWRPEASLDGAPTLERFLAERVELLIDPPLGAN